MDEKSIILEPRSKGVITISYHDLLHFDHSNINNQILEKIGDAFGSGADCLGILAVTDVPGLSEKRECLLPLARRLAVSDNLEVYEHPESFFQVGWSHGREIFAGKPDVAKGSFYANPVEDNLANLRQVTPNMARENPAFFAPNVWPTTIMPELEPAFKDLGQLVVTVGRLLTKPCDAYVKSRCPGYQHDKLTSVLDKSMCHKGRLLHYFARDDTLLDQTTADGWCGWHNDHSSLTGLVPGMFLDGRGHQVTCSDAGLSIQSRHGSVVSVELPPNSLGFQIGETAQIHTGGILQATPHAVRSTQVPGVTRESFVVFLEPEYDDTMELPVGRHVDDVQDSSIPLPSSVQPLHQRWCHGQSFGEFSNATFSAFH